MNYLNDYEELYNNIAVKFKKHSKYKIMFKKPNFPEASEALNNLIKMMNEEECPEYAGVFYLTKARCDTVSKEIQDEAFDLILAGENFIKAEKKLKDMNSVSVEDFLECAFMCYMYAMQILMDAEYYNLCLMNGLRFVEILKEFKKYNDAINIYSILLTFKLNMETKVTLLIERGHCQIKSRNFNLALMDYKEAIDCVETNFGSNNSYGRFIDLLCEAETNRVFLVLKTEAHMKDVNLLKDYSLDKITHTQAPLLLLRNDELYYSLIGLITSVVNNDYASAEEAAVDIQRFLSDTQNDLVREIIEELINPSGDPF